MTELGPVAIETVETPSSLVALETQYIVEVIDPDGRTPAPDGQVGELVLTNLGRAGCPLIRYRTGDLVRIRKTGSSTLFDGGILGRTDDMIHLRGNNLYPGSIEAVIRRFPDVAEFRIVIDQSEALADLHIEVEPIPNAEGSSLADAVGRAIRDELLFRVEVVHVPAGTLPRYEMKARRIVRKMD